MTDFDAIAQGMTQAVPFAGYLGLEITSVSEGEAVVRLPERPELTNHVGSQHAGALFAAGEAASGGAFVATFGERLPEVTPFAESAEISYKKIARGPITATGRLSQERDELLDELESEGSVRFPIDVELTNGAGDVVAEMTVRWYVRKND